jgi:DNA (cytosine-5)-methyltransferase 1
MNDQATEELVPTLGQNTGMATGRAGTILTSGVRRLTPVECARLQGFPDDWNDHLADTHRYRQYGNAVCVPVAEWVGRRIINQEEK